MIRAASKNHDGVAVVVDPHQRAETAVRREDRAVAIPADAEGHHLGLGPAERRQVGAPDAPRTVGDVGLGEGLVVRHGLFVDGRNGDENGRIAKR